MKHNILPIQTAFLAALMVCGPAGGAESDAGAATQPAAKTVYSCDFEKPTGPEWTHTKRENTPKGNRSFLGRFGKGNVVALAIEKLPPHKFLRVSFDLYIIETWDGEEDGDTWRLAVANGPTLVHATFSNHLFPDEQFKRFSKDQSYPNRHGLRNVPPRTGATENDTLGYTRRYNMLGGMLRKADSVYRMVLSFAHRGASVRLNFSATLNHGLDDESWGLDNLKVEVLPEAPRKDMPQEEVAKLWADLGSNDAVRASKAVWGLVEVGDRAAALLSKKLAPLRKQMKAIGHMVRELGDERYVVRRRAAKGLRQHGKLAVHALMAARRSGSDELRIRASEILEQIGPEGDPKAARIHRALWVLELLRPGPIDQVKKAAALRRSSGQAAVKERRQFDLAQAKRYEQITREMWANLPQDYEWLRDWEWV
jgi:hypothetical protein